jgi:hypothetical protein
MLDFCSIAVSPEDRNLQEKSVLVKTADLPIYLAVSGLDVSHCPTFFGHFDT